jgi:hypothetical protein
MVILVYQHTVLALEPTNTIKANVQLKSTTSWDGQTIIYPKVIPEITGVTVEIPVGVISCYAKNYLHVGVF